MSASRPRPPGRLRLQILGPLRAWYDDVELNTSPHQQSRLLALLLAREGRPISVTGLIDLLWGSEPPASAVNVIHKYIGALRRLIEPDLPLRSTGAYLIRHGSAYRFEAGPETLDLVAFRASVAEAKACLGMDRPEEALNRYTEALALCHGASADGLADNPGVEGVFAAVDSEVLDAVVDAARLAVRSGSPARVLAALRVAAEMAPLNEPVHAGLITALADAGHQAEALARYRVIRERLADELGIDPGHDLRLAHRQVLEQPRRPAADVAEVVPSVPLVRPAQLPPDLPSFVGRTAELDILGSLVAGPDDGRQAHPSVVAMDGMGGVGKSTLAVHFAHQVAARFPDGQLYLDLQGHLNDEMSLSTDDALRSLLYALGVAASGVPGTSAARTGLYRSLTAGKRLVVLLDNVGTLSQVRPLLPGSAESLVLLTSRHPLRGLAALEDARLLRIDPPDLPTARELVGRRLAGLPHHGPDRTADTEVVDEIIELCGRLPLALAILAARMAARPRLSLADVAAELRDGARLEAFPGTAELRDPRTAFAWSYRQLSPSAARLFRLLAMAPKAGLTVAACRSLSGSRPDRTRADLDELADAALVSENDNGRFTSHVLVKAYADELVTTVESPADRHAALTRLLQHHLHSSFNAQVVLAPIRTPIAPAPPAAGIVPEDPATYEESIAWFAEQREVLNEVIRMSADHGFGVIAWQLAITMQQYLHWAGYFHDWEQNMRVALRAAQSSGDPVGEAHVRRSQAGALFYQGDTQEALRQLSAALEIYGGHDLLLEQALTLANLHSVYTAIGRHDDALASSAKAMRHYRILGSQRAEVFSLKATGQSLVRLGRPEESVRALQQAVALNARHGRMHDEAELRVLLANSYLAMDRAPEAIAEFRHAAADAGEVGLKTYHFEALSSLAEVLVTTGDLPAAVTARDEAGAVLRSFQGGGTEAMRTAFSSLTRKLARPGRDR